MAGDKPSDRFMRRRGSTSAAADTPYGRYLQRRKQAAESRDVFRETPVQKDLREGIPALSAQEEVQQKASSVISRENLDPSATMTGGLLGFEATPGGIPAKVVGGGLGAAAGYFMAENVRDVARILNEKMGTNIPVADAPDLGERLDRAANEMFFDMAGSQLSPALGLVTRMGKAGVRKIFGIGAEGMARAEEARKFGINLAAEDVGNKFAEFFPIVVGRFPLVGGAFRKAAERKAGEIIKGHERLLYRLGPVANMSTFGVKLDKTVTKEFNIFRDHINAQYKEAFDLARRTGATLPSEGMKESVTQVIAELIRRKGTVDKKNPVIKFFREQVDRLPERVSLDRYDGLMDQWDEALQKAKKDAFSTTGMMVWKGDAEKALMEMDNQEVAQAFMKADATFANTMASVFETPTAQKFGRAITKNRFRVGAIEKPGTRNPDESFKVAFNTDSPQAIRDLKRLINDPEVFEEGMASWLSDNFDDALASGLSRFQEGKGGVGFNLDQLEKNLGLGRESGTRYAAMKEALKDTNLPIETLEAYVTQMKHAMSTMPPKANAFIARRLTLGGLGGLKSAILPGATAAAGAGMAGTTGVITGITFVLSARAIARSLTNPRILQKGVEAMDPALTMSKRRASLLTMYHMVTGDIPLGEKPMEEKVKTMRDNIKVGPFQPENISPALTRDLRSAKDTIGDIFGK